MKATRRVIYAVYRTALWVLPLHFRRAYGDEMAVMFQDRLQRAAARPPAAGRLLRLCRRELAAVLATSVRARLQRRHPTEQSPEREPVQLGAGTSARATGTIARRTDTIAARQAHPHTRSLLMDSLLLDLKTALRSLHANRASAAAALVALGLGIGASAAIFSVVYGVLQPLPYPGGERFALVYEDRAGDRTSQMRLSAPEYLALDADTETFEALSGYLYAGALLEGEPYPESVGAVRLAHDFMDLLDSRPLWGREFTEADVDGDPVVVLGHALWQRRFGADPGVVGSTITISDTPYQVIGVTDAEFTYFNDTDRVFFLLTFTPEQVNRNGTHNVLALGRLRADLSTAEADQHVRAIGDTAQRLDDHAADEHRDLYVYSLYDAWVGAVRRPLLVLMGAVGVLVLIACANVANLEIARGMARSRELAVRLALGARPSRLVRQLLTESLLLALLGGAVGVVVAWLSMSALRALIAANLPRADNIALDGRVLGFALLLSIAAGVLAGLAPAWVVSRQQLVDPIKEGGSTVAGSRGTALLRKAFLVAQVAMALVLGVGAGLLARSVGHLRAVDLGFEAPGVVIGRVSVSRPEYRDGATLRRFLDDLRQQVARHPDVESVGLTNIPPGGGVLITEEFALAGNDDPEPIRALMQAADAGFFAALRINALRGRVLSADDEAAGGEPVVLVNETLARRFWTLDGAVGQQLRLAAQDDAPWMTVVGVVPDMRSSPLAPSTIPAVLLPATWRTAATMAYPSLVVRGDIDAETATAWLRTALGEIDDRLPAPTLQPLDDLVANSFARQRLNSILLGIFAGIASLLAAVGVYAVIQYVVRQRTAEIGIRIALGARVAEVVTMVLRQGVGLAVVGVLLGLGGAWAASRLIAGMLHGVAPTDALTYVASAAFLVAVATAASLLPAWRAGRVDPVIALRDQ